MPDPQKTSRALDEALRAIAEQDARLGASPQVETQVMAAFDALAAARRRRARAIVAVLGSAAAVAAAIFALQGGGLKLDRAQPQTADVRRQTPPREVTTAFLPLTYSGVPIADGHVVRMEVPRASLASFGLLPAEAADSSRGGTVIADVIVGDDGLARAVRFVRKVDRKEPQR